MTLPNGVGPPAGLSRTERKFWDVLADGKPHSPEELVKCLWDDLGINLRSSIKFHISNIRRQLPTGYHITAVRRDDKACYILVRELAVPDLNTPKAE